MRILAALVCLFTIAGTAYADSITILPAGTPFTAPETYSVINPPCTVPDIGCARRAFDRTGDLAWVGGEALQAVVSTTIGPPYTTFHGAAGINDGFYGNGSSWIPGGGPQWLKIDLGEIVGVDSLQFGRDRLGYFNDRDPGTFRVFFALADDVYASGNSSNDLTEYTLAMNSLDHVFAGTIFNTQTVRVDFDSPQVARFVMLQFDMPGVAIDEVEVFGAEVSEVPEPGSLLLLGGGLAALIGVRVRAAALRSARGRR